jgi:hypothetical protein
MPEKKAGANWYWNIPKSRIINSFAPNRRYLYYLVSNMLYVRISIGVYLAIV